jgi:hypothetical protein
MKAELNEYLFHEFGSDGHTSQISESWPFPLTSVGVFDGEHFFEFEVDGEGYYAIYGTPIRMLKRDGTLTDILRQIRGGRWIGRHNPVDLNTSRGDHPVIPRIPERRAEIERLAGIVKPGRSVRILEGLFLEESKEYLGLVQFGDEASVTVVGNSFCIPNISTGTISPWKILSRAIGEHIELSRKNG